MVAIAAYHHWYIKQLDVVTAFLNGVLAPEGTVFMSQPAGFEVPSNSTGSPLICRLNKSLDGLKQAPRIWHREIHGYLLFIHFTRSKYNSNLHFRRQDTHIVFLLLWVDDM